MRYKLTTILVAFFLFCVLPAKTQEYKNLLQQLDTSRVERTVATFKSSRLILGQSTVQVAKKELQFRISHLFGRISDGFEELYGIDQMYNVDFSFEYGLSNTLQLGLARSNDFDKTVQFSIKKAVKSQSTKSQPAFSLSYFGSVNVRTKDYDESRSFGDRLEYYNQILLSRKFSQKFSAQIAPNYTYISRVFSPDHPHSLFATNLGFSLAITNATNLNMEYVYTFPTFESDLYDFKKNVLSIGFDIETGGHVFQLFITNATRVQPGSFVQQYNNDDFFKGHIHLGFSIMRSFNFK